MVIKIMKKDTFFICGYLVETTLEQNDKDVSALYDDFFGSDKVAVLKKLNGSKKGYYGLSWYTKGHERYCYLLGLAVGQDNRIPENAFSKKVPETTYMVAYLPKESDIIKAWTEFFYQEIPKAGYKVNAEFNLYFEYYPSGVKEDYELWVPVLKADT